MENFTKIEIHAQTTHWVITTWIHKSVAAPKFVSRREVDTSVVSRFLDDKKQLEIQIINFQKGKSREKAVTMDPEVATYPTIHQFLNHPKRLVEYSDTEDDRTDYEESSPPTKRRKYLLQEEWLSEMSDDEEDVHSGYCADIEENQVTSALVCLVKEDQSNTNFCQISVASTMAGQHSLSAPWCDFQNSRDALLA